VLGLRDGVRLQPLEGEDDSGRGLLGDHRLALRPEGCVRAQDEQSEERDAADPFMLVIFGRLSMEK